MESPAAALLGRFNHGVLPYQTSEAAGLMWVFYRLAALSSAGEPQQNPDEMWILNQYGWDEEKGRDCSQVDAKSLVPDDTSE